LPSFVAIHPTFPDTGLPFWFGNLELHNSHQSNLNRKDNTYYQFNVPIDLPYLWADTETKTTKWGTKPNETKQKVKR